MGGPFAADPAWCQRRRAESPVSACENIDDVETAVRPGPRASMVSRDATMRFIAKRNLWEAVALQCGVSARAVRQWKRVPSARVLDVERAIGRPRHLIRPDIHSPG